jgi:hypothetical protein
MENQKRKNNGTWILCCCRTPASYPVPPRHSFRLHLKPFQLGVQPYLFQEFDVFVVSANKKKKLFKTMQSNRNIKFNSARKRSKLKK